MSEILNKVSSLINEINSPEEGLKVVSEIEKLYGLDDKINGFISEVLKIVKDFASGAQKDLSEAYSLCDRFGWEIYNMSENTNDNKTKEQISRDYFDIPKEAEADIIRDFITESRENLISAEEALLKLESNPNDKESINKVFRCFHTIKGTSSFVGLNYISEFAHLAENLLVKIRDAKINFNSYYADLSLKSIDVLKELIDKTEKKLDDPDYKITKPEMYHSTIDKLKNPEKNEVSDREPSPVKSEMNPDKKGGGLKEIGLENQKETSSSNQIADSSNEEKTIRIRTDKLDRLIDTIGEMSITFSMVAQDIERLNNQDMIKKSHQLEKIVKELQEIGMSMRMVPIKNMFQKMVRLVRDLSRKTGKKVITKVSGEETEIDRNMINVVEELLVHMVRNSVDHGIENPDERLKYGKQENGTVNLRAYNADGNVVFEIEDDGRGLNKEKILKKAIEKGLVKKDENLSDNEIYDLIFLPGFSTADKVSDVSGRGVGMDVVKKGVESLRGKIDISSKEGKGTLFKLKFPLTMAVTDGMLVKIANERYVISVNTVSILAKPEEGKIYTINSKEEVFSLRGEIIPVFRMRKILAIRDKEQDKNGIFVIIQDKNKKMAIMVDEVLGKQQVVAKPLSGINNFPGILGGCILGDGRVAVIIDPQGIINYYRQNFKEKREAVLV